MTTALPPASRLGRGPEPCLCHACDGGKFNRWPKQCPLCVGWGTVSPVVLLGVLETAHVRALQARLDPQPLTFPERLRRDQEATRAEEAFADALAAHGTAWERDGPKGWVRWELDRMGRPRLIGRGSGPGLSSATRESRPTTTPVADPCAVAFEAYVQATAAYYKARRLGSQHRGWDRASALNAQRRREFVALLRERPNGIWQEWTADEGGNLFAPAGWTFAKEMARREKGKGH